MPKNEKKYEEYWVHVSVLVDARGEEDAEQHVLNQLQGVFKDANIVWAEYNHDQYEEEKRGVK